MFTSLVSEPTLMVTTPFLVKSSSFLSTITFTVWFPEPVDGCAVIQLGVVIVQLVFELTEIVFVSLSLSKG